VCLCDLCRLRLPARCLSKDPSARPKLPALGAELRALLDKHGGAAARENAPVMDDPYGSLPIYSGFVTPRLAAVDPGEPQVPTGMVVDTARVSGTMQSLGIEEPLCDAVAGVVMDKHANCVDVALLPAVMRAVGVPAMGILLTVCGMMKVG
jgi:hypothetical protein